jgi:phage gp36-like protein
MTVATYFFTDAQLASRIGKDAVRALFDDNQDGVADTDNLTALKRDATACVSGYMRGIYALPLEEPVSAEVTRLALDVAVAYASERHPELTRRDWRMLWDKVRQELCDVRSGKTRLDISAATNPAIAPSNVGGNVGTMVSSEQANGTSSAEVPEAGSFWGEMGDY